MKKELSEKELSEIVKKVASKTIGYDIEPVKYEDIPSKLAEILSKYLKEKVEVSGSGLDGNSMVVKVKNKRLN